MLVFSANPISTTARLPMLLYIIVSKEYLMINTFFDVESEFLQLYSADFFKLVNL